VERLDRLAALAHQVQVELRDLRGRAVLRELAHQESIMTQQQTK
jgi:hypothetical protein